MTHRLEDAAYIADAAMRGGIAQAPVSTAISGKQTLADMLSEHTCNYRTDSDAPTPCHLLAAMLAAGLARKCPHAEEYAKRIAQDYAVSHEIEA